MPDPSPVAAPTRRLVVAIDGPSGSGKSTVARAVAHQLGLRYLDTGAMFRALTYRALRGRIGLDDDERLTDLAERTELDVGTDPQSPWIRADGDELTEVIRTSAVTDAVSAVSAVPGVRAALLRRQREIIGSGGIVVEGRDIGTVVAPDAPVKIFLTASARARAARRYHQQSRAGGGPAPDRGLRRTEADIDRRDRLDANRSLAPLRQAPDAVELDSTTLTPAQVIAEILARCPAPVG